MPKAAIFDVDGTLVDSVDLHARAWQEAFAHFGIPAALDAVRSQIGKGADQLMPVFVPRERLDREHQQLEEYRKQLFQRKYMSNVKGFPRVRELFQRLLGQGTLVALASSAKGDELQRYKELAGIDDLVHSEATSDDAEKSKPHPDIFEAALDRLPPLDRSAVFVIGDSPYDAEAAGKAGLRSIGVLSGGFAEELLRKAGAMAIYRDPADLLERLDESPLRAQ